MAIKSITYAALLCLSATPALAEKTGFYGGFSVLDTFDQSWDWYPDGAFRSRFPLDGSAPGLFAGHNWSFSSFILGAELAFHGEGIVEPTDPGYNIQRIIDLKARVGTEIGNVFVYGYAGPSFARWDDFFETINADGHTYGLGAEVPLGENAFFGIEYGMHDLTGEYVESRGGRLMRHEINFSSVAFRMGMRF